MEPSSTGPWDVELAELAHRVELAQAMGGAEAVARHHERGRLTIRERIDKLADAHSFNEIGRLTGKASYDDAGRLVSVIPANYLMGEARVDGRPVVIAGYDYTVRGGATDGGLLDKRSYAERMAHDQKVPLVRLVEGA
ncbi:MAG: carboxyl transferase domain-containing protein, partial [Acidimicrobiales bacterium]